MWEYKTIYKGAHEVDLHNMEQFLNTKGKQHWELVHVFSKFLIDNSINYANHTFVFKRKVK